MQRSTSAPNFRRLITVLTKNFKKGIQATVITISILAAQGISTYQVSHFAEQLQAEVITNKNRDVRFDLQAVDKPQ